MANVEGLLNFLESLEIGLEPPSNNGDFRGFRELDCVRRLIPCERSTILGLGSSAIRPDVGDASSATGTELER